MITGTVNERREALISIEVHGSRGKRLVMDAVIDTGFDGFLILPPSLIEALGLRRLGSEDAELGDGSIRKLAVYSAGVMWDGAMRFGRVNAAEIEPLVGMELLAGYELRIQVAEGGAVTIEAMA